MPHRSPPGSCFRTRLGCTPRIVLHSWPSEAAPTLRLPAVGGRVPGPAAPGLLQGNGPQKLCPQIRGPQVHRPPSLCTQWPLPQAAPSSPHSPSVSSVCHSRPLSPRCGSGTQGPKIPLRLRLRHQQSRSDLQMDRAALWGLPARASGPLGQPGDKQEPP